MDQSRPWQDYGFFGPGSVSWRIWSSPTSLLGFQRSVVLEHFDPFLTAAVADQAGIYRDPHGRLDRTLAYFLTVAVADGHTAIAASEVLMRVHAIATGIEPISGKRYSANNPDSQLWIHLTGWHSVLKCYERYGPGKLSEDEERQFWAECAVAAELQTCKPSDVPRNRDELRAYYAEVRPRLCTSEAAQRGMQHLLRPHRKDVGFLLWTISRVTAPPVIATLPRWMRKLGGYRQPKIVDSALWAPTTAGAWAASLPFLNVPLLRIIAPQTAAVLDQHQRRGVPEHQFTVTPAEARERYRATVSDGRSTVREEPSLTS